MKVKYGEMTWLNVNELKQKMQAMLYNVKYYG